MIVVATTLARPKYQDDLKNVIGLPFGSILKWRYSKEYIGHERELRSGGEVILSLLTSVDDLLPLRFAKIFKVYKSGSLVELECRLLGFVDDSVKKELAEIKGVNKKQLIYGVDSKKVHSLKRFKVEDWESVATKVVDLLNTNSYKEQAKRIPYLYYLEIFKKDGVRMGISPKGMLTIESGELLDIRVNYKAREINSEQVALGEIRIDSPASCIDMISSRRCRVDSSRDSKRITLKAKNGYNSRFDHLSIKLVNFIYPHGFDVTSEDYQRLEVNTGRADIPLRAGFMLPHITSLAAGASVAVALVGFSSISENIGWFFLVTFLAYMGIYRGLK